MGRKKETKPLLNKNAQQQQHSLQTEKAISKGKSGKSKLPSVSEASLEGAKGQGSTKSEEKCLEKDANEAEEEEQKDSESVPELGEGKHMFGVRSYLHHFYESVQSTTTPGQVITGPS
jgi:hypothetical protein